MLKYKVNTGLEICYAPTFGHAKMRLLRGRLLQRFIIIGNNGKHALIHILGATYIFLTMWLTIAQVVVSSEGHRCHKFGIAKALAIPFNLSLTLDHGHRNQSIVKAIVHAGQQLLHSRQATANILEKIYI